MDLPEEVRHAIQERQLQTYKNMRIAVIDRTPIHSRSSSNHKEEENENDTRVTTATATATPNSTASKRVWSSSSSPSSPTSTSAPSVQLHRTATTNTTTTTTTTTTATTTTDEVQKTIKPQIKKVVTMTPTTPAKPNYVELKYTMLEQAKQQIHGIESFCHLNQLHIRPIITANGGARHASTTTTKPKKNNDSPSQQLKDRCSWTNLLPASKSKTEPQRSVIQFQRRDYSQQIPAYFRVTKIQSISLSKRSSLK